MLGGRARPEGAEAPTTRGLAEAVSPLRMRGMVTMLARIKRQVRAKTAA